MSRSRWLMVLGVLVVVALGAAVRQSRHDSPTDTRPVGTRGSSSAPASGANSPALRSFRLRRGGQLSVGGRNLGILVMSPKENDRAARVGVGPRLGAQPAQTARTFEVRKGDLIDVGDLVLRTTNVEIGTQGFVEFDVLREPPP